MSFLTFMIGNKYPSFFTMFGSVISTIVLLRSCSDKSCIYSTCTHIQCNLFTLCSLNRLCELPRGFGSFPALEILDLTYNNLTNSSFSANFSYLGECLRCLYMGDNDLTEFPPQIEKFVHLEIVSLYLLHIQCTCSLRYTYEYIHTCTYVRG